MAINCINQCHAGAVLTENSVFSAMIIDKVLFLAMIPFLIPAIPSDQSFIENVTRNAMHQHVAQSGRYPGGIDGYIEETRPDLSNVKIIRIGEQPVGWVAVTPNRKSLYIDHIHILPEWQRQGIGRRVLESIVEDAQKMQLPIKLSFLLGNPAEKLYDSLGFEAYAIRNGRVCMKRSFVPEPSGLDSRKSFSGTQLVM
jgi:ribosomal protein S18 acetylase RimI-like enzyme